MHSTRGTNVSKEPRTYQDSDSFLSILLKDAGVQADYARSALETQVHYLLHEAFLKSGLNQAEIARRLSVSRQRVHQVLSGDAPNLTLGLMGRAAGVLGLKWRLALDDINTDEEQFAVSSSPIRRRYKMRWVEPRWSSKKGLRYSDLAQADKLDKPIGDSTPELRPLAEERVSWAS
jgi:transcriptional regulator with XRE-family HTH domain